MGYSLFPFYQKYKASWNLINVVGKRKIRSSGIISAKDPEDRVKLWYKHFLIEKFGGI